METEDSEEEKKVERDVERVEILRRQRDEENSERL